MNETDGDTEEKAEPRLIDRIDQQPVIEFLPHSVLREAGGDGGLERVVVEDLTTSSCIIKSAGVPSRVARFPTSRLVACVVVPLP